MPAHEPWVIRRQADTPVDPVHPTALALASYVEREVAAMEAEGRTMAAWLEKIEPTPGMEPGRATEAIREAHEAAAPRELG